MLNYLKINLEINILILYINMPRDIHDFQYIDK